MARDKFGIHIKWDYANCCCRISMPGYIENLLIKFKHPHPHKPRLSPYKCLPISYGAKAQLTPEADTSELLDEHRKRRIQEIVGSLLYYARVVNNKLLVALSAIVARQAFATIATEQAVHLLLDYVATYPADGIVYRSSDMILCAHADASFLNETNSRGRVGAHIFLSENDPFPRFNGAVLSITSSLWLQLPNQNLQPSSSQHAKWAYGYFVLLAVCSAICSAKFGFFCQAEHMNR